MKNVFKFLLTAIITCFSHAALAEKAETLDRVHPNLKSIHMDPLNPELALELLDMREENQAMRTRIKDYKNVSAEERKAMEQLDQKNNIRLKEIISTVGWPGIRLVGIQASSAMWSLVLIQNHDPEFQKQCLASLKDAVQHQDANIKHYAYLLDTVRRKDNLPQVYGTVWELQQGKKVMMYPCENMETLNQRRQEVGLNTIEKYKEQMKAAYRLTDADFE